MEQSTTREATGCTATQELPSILWNPEVHNRAYKSVPLVPILKQVNPVHATLQYPSNIRINIVYPSTFWSASFWFSHQ
jgi:hypothetical protein